MFRSFFFSVLFGIVISIFCAAGLWLSVPLLLSPFTDRWLSIFPFLVVVPTLIVGGYAAKWHYGEEISVAKTLILGGTVGILLTFLGCRCRQEFLH